jgi:hypothetical protein
MNAPSDLEDAGIPADMLVLAPPKPVERGHVGAISAGAAAIGALAVGAVAIGALVIFRLAIGRLSVGHGAVRHSHFGKVKIDELVVRKLTVLERRGE